MFGVVVCASVALAKPYRITVAPPAQDRLATVVTFNVPTDAPKSAALRDAAGKSLPVQTGAGGTGTFVIPQQRAGEALIYVLDEAPTVSRVTVENEPGRMHVAIDGAAVLDYRTDKDALPRSDIDSKYKRAGYLHPLLTPAGKIVSGDYPSNHIHHHGIWSPWTKTQFQGRKPDFWNMQDRTGTVEFAGIERTWSGPVHGGFVSRQRMIDLSAPTPVAALNETWEVTVYDVRGAPLPMRVFDLAITQTCATSDPLVLPQYHYGGLGYRGRDEWNGKANFTVLTSEGETDRVKANATRLRWIFAGGAVEGNAQAGVAVFDRPDNFRAPQPVRVHPEMPYWSITPSQLGDWAIEPGQPYVAHYRFIAVDGVPTRAQLEACWNGYATPVKVTVGSM